MLARHRARRIAVQALYSREINDVPLDELLAFSWITGEDAAGADLEFARLLVSGTIEAADTVDTLIREHLQHWDLERTALVERSILRVAVYSLRFQRDIPPQVTIDEAVELAKSLASDDSYRFVNGVLDAINRTIETSDNGA